MEEKDLGVEMYNWVKSLFPIPRSLTGSGVRETLRFLQSIVPSLKINGVKSGTKVFDWNVPDEWNLAEAYILDAQGKCLIHTDVNNLHVVGYSTPVDLLIEKDELEKHLHSLPNLPDAIPYVTSYYEKRWGFCLSQNQRNFMGDGPFRVVIRAELGLGEMNFGELIIPGSTPAEVLLSTYICHPSMANNELSGPVVSIALARWLISLPNRRFTYRILFLPETIGAISYLSTNLAEMKKNTIAGWVLTCMGDSAAISFLPSRNGNTLTDRISRAVLRESRSDWTEYSYLDRGSDERQYCSPGVDLPVASIMRSKYGTYPEYHTSLDDLNFVSAEGLLKSFQLMKRAIQVLEQNHNWKANQLCEPQLGGRGLYPTISTHDSQAKTRDFMNVLAYCDGDHDLMQLSEKCGIPIDRCLEILEVLHANNLIRE